MDHLQAGVEESFAVFPEPSAFFQPCEGPLDDPSLGHDGEGVQFISFGDLHGGAEFILHRLAARIEEDTPRPFVASYLLLFTISVVFFSRYCRASIAKWRRLAMIHPIPRFSMRSALRCVLAFLAFSSLLLAQTKPTVKLAATPPMGWNSWNHFGEKVNDADVRAAADALVSSGMRDAGYIYVNLDDTWEGQRDAQGNIQPNSKFPDMKALAEYVHSKGLKFGIYSSPGPKTCGEYEGSYGHEQQDANTYAKWGVDYLLGAVLDNYF